MPIKRTLGEPGSPKKKVKVAETDTPTKEKEEDDEQKAPRVKRQWVDKSAVTIDWSLIDRALFRRALVRYGPSFTDIANAIGTKNYSLVKSYYQALGASKADWIKPLLAAHSRLKKLNQLETFAIILSPAEEQALNSGKISMFNDVA